MSVTEISVKRPTAVWMAVVLILALGVFGYKSMGSSLLPDMNMPILSIMTTYNGASAEDIKKDIVKPIEDSVSGISGVDTISSTSQEGSGSVMIKFKSSANMNTAYLDVQKAMDNASRRLPKDADKPTIFKMDTNAIPILVVSLNGNANSDELYNEGDTLKQKLEKIPGVGQVSIMGAQKKELVIRIDKTAMEYYGVSTNTISSKIQAANTTVPAGQIKQDNMNQSVRVIGQFNNIDSVKNMLIPTTAGGTVRLGDIAKVSLEAPEDTSIMRYKGKKTLAVVISKQSDANVVEVADTVKKELQSMKKRYSKWN
ncbi:acriflavin resistance protein [Clostridium carboxidivorans P7]|uniref:Acriflavin resistance protein n=1 Tax=Clostridium carboxidivorans P7 TaxID=536227 RepID=C6PR75_9CLOT|nr:acriflavin resistance protein [Clostridium carboxidivorans P7]